MFLKIKELLDAGAIGAVRLVNLRLYHPPHPSNLTQDSLSWRVQPEIAGGGYFLADRPAGKIMLYDAGTGKTVKKPYDRIF